MAAPRFQNDPDILSCLTPLGGRVFKLNDTGAAVKMIQQALIDLAFGPPGLDTGTFTPATDSVVRSYQGARGLAVTGIVDTLTMVALDLEMMDKPPFPFSDRDEWLNWNLRAVPGIDPFNFRRLDWFNLAATFRNLQTAPVSLWLPPTFSTPLLQALRELLNPAGSPDGLNTPAASWGMAPGADLYHCHVGYPKIAGLEPPGAPTDVTLKAKAAALRTKADIQSGAPRATAVWTAKHKDLLTNSQDGHNYLLEANALVNAILARATPTQPAQIVVHSFEDQKWRPATMGPADPRRHWRVHLSPFKIERSPFLTPQAELANYFFSLQVSFIADRSGTVFIMPELLEACSVAGLPFQLVSSFANITIP